MNQKKQSIRIAALSAIAILATATLYYTSTNPGRIRQKTYQNPTMARWLDYFQIDPYTKTHPSRLERIAQDYPGSKTYSAESPFLYDFLVTENHWSMGGPGKLYLVINDKIVATGADLATNGTCLFKFTADDLKPGPNKIRADILVQNPQHIHGWIVAKGPEKEFIYNNTIPPKPAPTP